MILYEEQQYGRELENGVVMHSSPGSFLSSCLSRSWKQGRGGWLSDRFFSFLCLLGGDLMLFGIIVGYMILFHEEDRLQGFRVGGHLHFRRERKLPRRGCGKQYFMLYLMMFPQVVSAQLLNDTGPFWTEGSLARSQFWGHEEDGISFMARSEISWEPPELPSQHLESQEASDGFSEVSNRPGDDDTPSIQDGQGRRERRGHYQLAFIFTLDPKTYTCRLNWDDYWVMHRQIAEVISEDVNSLISIFNVEHLPKDLEELETPAVIPLRGRDFAPGSVFVHILVDVEAHEDQNVEAVLTKRFATSFPAQRTRKQALQTIGVGEYCESQGDGCLLWHNGAPWKQQDYSLHDLNNGDYVRCALPPPQELCKAVWNRAVFGNEEGELFEEQDGGSLMQRTMDVQEETPSAVLTTTAHVLAFGNDYIEVSLEDFTGTIAAALCEQWDFDMDEIQDLHEVLEPPFHFQKPGEIVFLLELQGDRAERLFEDDSVILTELIIVSATSNQKMTIRNVMWARRYMKRFQIHSLMRTEAFCDRSNTAECVILHNNRIWHKEDKAAHRVSHGDYLAVEAFVKDISLTEARRELDRFEEHERQRTIYTGSSNDRCENNIGSTNRSRSRGSDEEDGGDDPGSGALGAEEVSSRDSADPGEPFQEDDSPSLLQLRMNKICRVVFVDPCIGLAPPGNPSEGNRFQAPTSTGSEQSSNPEHVDTRKWCGDPIVVDDVPVDEVEEEQAYRGDYRVNLEFPDNAMDFVKLLQRWEESPLMLQLPNQLDISPTTQQFLQSSLHGWHGNIQQLHIYTDGSFQQKIGISTFALAIFGWTQTEGQVKSTFLGWLADVVITDDAHPNFVGAAAHAALDAEVSALTWSHIWLLQSSCLLPVTFHFDAQVAGFGASGEWRVDEGKHNLKRLRQLVHLTQKMRMRSPTEYQHVKAHSNQPCNDLVDRLAAYQATLGANRRPFPEWRPLFQQNCNVMEWAWWHFSALGRDPSLPQYKDGAFGWKEGHVKTGMDGIKNIENGPQKQCNPSRTFLGRKMCMFTGRDWRMVYMLDWASSSLGGNDQSALTSSRNKHGHCSAVEEQPSRVSLSMTTLCKNCSSNVLLNLGKMVLCFRTVWIDVDYSSSVLRCADFSSCLFSGNSLRSSSYRLSRTKQTTSKKLSAERMRLRGLTSIRHSGL